MNNIKRNSKYSPHRNYKDVFVKTYFTNNDNKYINSIEVKMLPNTKILNHIHEKSMEFIYCISGNGFAMIDKLSFEINKGDAYQVPIGATHSLENRSKDELILYCVFSPISD